MLAESYFHILSYFASITCLFLGQVERKHPKYIFTCLFSSDFCSDIEYVATIA